MKAEAVSRRYGEMGAVHKTEKSRQERSVGFGSRERDKEEFRVRALF